MMKRVGILTRHCYPNYGSILQAYALQSALKNLGAEPVVIDYVSDDDSALGLIRSNLRISKKAQSNLGLMMYIAVQTPTFLSMFSTFRRHQKRLLNLSYRVRDHHDLSKIGGDLDLAIAGSDQVWNRIIDSIDRNYFLSFMKTRSQRFSYAASLGSVAPLPEDEGLLLASIKEIQTVSVREPASARWISEKGIEVRADVDPVLLHGRQFWEGFCAKKRMRSRYILVYELNNSPGFTKRLKEIQLRMDLPIVRVSPDWKHIFRPGRSKILISPESFLSWFRDAACVVTDSFHGTSFALKFGRPLYVIPPGKYSNRLSDMLARVGLERLIVSSEKGSPLPETPMYDGNEVERLLEEHAATSWEYLRLILEGS